MTPKQITQAGTLIGILSTAAGCPADPTMFTDGLQAQPPERRSPNNPRVAREGARSPMAPREVPNGPPTLLEEFRTIDGTLNNESNPTWGSTNTAFIRRAAAAYADGFEPSGADRPNVRAISQAVCAEGEPILNTLGATDFVWQWGQFLDHDIDLTPEVDPIEAFDIAVPRSDSWFDPFGTGTVFMPFGRSLSINQAGIPQQVNAITAFIDGSNVYGSDAERAAALRTSDGSGKLKTSTGDLLPFNTAGLPNAAAHGLDPATLFLAGPTSLRPRPTASATACCRTMSCVWTRTARRPPRDRLHSPTPSLLPKF